MYKARRKKVKIVGSEQKKREKAQRHFLPAFIDMHVRTLKSERE